MHNPEASSEKMSRRRFLRIVPTAIVGAVGFWAGGISQQQEPPPSIGQDNSADKKKEEQTCPVCEEKKQTVTLEVPDQKNYDGTHVILDKIKNDGDSQAWVQVACPGKDGSTARGHRLMPQGVVYGETVFLDKPAATGQCSAAAFPDSFPFEVFDDEGDKLKAIGRPTFFNLKVIN
jgi:hypothetical protein